MIKAGVIGVGYLGKFHAEKYAALPEVELVGVADVDMARAREIASSTGCKPFGDYKDLLDEIDVASVVVPTTLHYEIAKNVLERSIHCLLEKPITTTVDEADELIELATKRSCVLQVGHLERFNPAIKFLEANVQRPLFIEAHRLAGFKPRAIDVDVVLDLMIHDLEIVLALVKSPLKDLHAVGVPVLTPRIDIANVRLIFENGCTANLTASRISLKSMRRIRIFQPGEYISADCQEKRNLKVTAIQGTDPMNAIKPEFVDHEECDILLDEIKDFITCVTEGREPKVSGREGRNALELALKINDQIELGLKEAEESFFPSFSD